MKMAPRTYTGASQRWTGYTAPYTTYSSRHSRPGLVAVVGTPGYENGGMPYDPSWGHNGYYPNNMAYNPNAYAQAHNGWTPPGWNSVEARVLSFDSDGNHVVDGRDWRALSPARRSELASILHGVRVRNNDRSVNSVASKLDWVYKDPNRLGLTLNMAFDYPVPNGAGISW